MAFSDLSAYVTAIDPSATVTGSTITFGGELSCHDLREIIAAGVVNQYDAVLSGGVFTLQPAAS